MIRSAPSRGVSEVALKSVQVSDSYKGSPNSKDLWARFQVSIHFVGTFFNRTWHWASQYASSALRFLPAWNASAPFQLTSLYRFSEPFSAYVKRSWMLGSANIWRNLSCFAVPLQNNRKHCALFHTLRDTLSHLLVCRPSISQDVVRFHCYTQWLVIRVDEKLFLFPFAIMSRKTMQGWILQRGFPENKLIKSCYSCCRKVIAGTNWYPHAHIFIIRFTSSYLKSTTEIGHDFATSLLSSHSSV